MSLPVSPPMLWGVALRVSDLLQVAAFIGAVVAAAWAFGPVGLFIGCFVLFLIGGAMRAAGVNGGGR
ncbi:MAG: hypothetical protein AB7G17_14210 [Phycisphaerales bacterium]